MRIKKIQLKNGYKRFYDLTIDFGEEPKRIVALVGANGCGKSSVFDGMLLINNTYAPLGNKGGRGYEYHSMNKTPSFDHQNVVLEFDKGMYNAIRSDRQEKGKENTILSFRSPYRYNNNFKVKESKALSEIRLNKYGASFTSDLDDKMEENYRRLNIKFNKHLKEADCRYSEAFGTRPHEFNIDPANPDPDRQKANSKDEDPTGLLNEGFRYRDLEAGVFITRDPLGFVNGPNTYTYVNQNPWTYFDPQGLEKKKKKNKKPKDDGDPGGSDAAGGTTGQAAKDDAIDSGKNGGTAGKSESKNSSNGNSRSSSSGENSDQEANKINNETRDNNQSSESPSGAASDNNPEFHDVALKATFDAATKAKEFNEGRVGQTEFGGALFENASIDQELFDKPKFEATPLVPSQVMVDKNGNAFNAISKSIREAFVPLDAKVVGGFHAHTSSSDFSPPTESDYSAAKGTYEYVGRSFDSDGRLNIDRINPNGSVDSFKFKP